MVMMTLVVIFVLTGFVIIRLAVVNHQRLAELGQRAGIVAERVALSATPTIWSIFDKSLDRHYTEDVASAIIDSELLDPIVSGVVVEGSFGHLFMGKVRTASGDIEFYDRQKHAAHLQTVDVIASHPIRQGILTIGSVNVYATPPPFSQTLQETLLLEFIEIAVTVGVIIFGLLIVINRTLLVPARQMAIARQAFESLNDGLFVTDPEGRLIDANTAYRKKLSSVADDGSDPPIQVLDSEIAGNLLQIWEGNSQHDGWQGETQIEDPSGKIVPVLISTAPVRDEGVRTGYTVTESLRRSTAGTAEGSLRSERACPAGQCGEVGIPGNHESRIADATERHHRLHRNAGPARSETPPGKDRELPCHNSAQCPASAEPD